MVAPPSTTEEEVDDSANLAKIKLNLWFDFGKVCTSENHLGGRGG